MHGTARRTWAITTAACVVMGLIDRLRIPVRAGGVNLVGPGGLLAGVDQGRARGPASRPR